MNSKETLQRLESRKNSVRTEDYINWLYEFIPEKGVVNDYDALLDSKGSKDTFNISLLSDFLMYVDELAKKQRVLNVPDAENEYSYLSYVIKIKNKFFNISNMVGQGSITFIEEVYKPEFCYVTIK